MEYLILKLSRKYNLKYPPPQGYIKNHIIWKIYFVQQFQIQIDKLMNLVKMLHILYKIFLNILVFQRADTSRENKRVGEKLNQSNFCRVY